MASPLNNSFETWTTPGNPGVTSGTLPNWTAYSINGGTATRQTAAPTNGETYSVNIRSSFAAPINSIGGIVSDAFYLSDSVLTWYQKSEDTRVTLTVRLYTSADVLLASFTPTIVTTWALQGWNVSAYKNQNVKVRFEQHTTQATAGYYTLIDLVKPGITTQSTILSDAKIKVVDKVSTILSNAKILSSYEGKFIHNNDLLIVTDTSPLKIIKVDISNPTISYSNYTVALYDNAKNLTIDHLRNQLYFSCNNGQVVKASIADPNTRSYFDVGVNRQLNTIVHNSDYLLTLIGDNVEDDSLFILDEANYSTINSDIRTRKSEQKIIKTWFETLKGIILNTDFRTLKRVVNKIKTDLRFIKYSPEVISSYPIARTDFHVYIDSIQLTDNDLKLDSIRINHTENNKSTASFTLTRKHDDINNPATITSNNIVTIYIKNRLEFTGRINKLDCSSSEETVIVSCESDEISTNYNITTIQLPLTKLNEKITLYDILINDISIENPYIQSDDENPTYYKGVKINLGMQIAEQVEIWYVTHSMASAAIDLEEGTFEFIPNYTYFWWVDAIKYNLEGGTTTGYGLYIGTSLAPLSNDIYDIEGVDYRYQKILDDVETELGWYYLGSAPYLEVSAKNGKKIAYPRWVDKEDGLYYEQGESYDYIQYCKDVAAIEYEKIKNINATILPKTNASIDLTIDGYQYYNLKLLTRINLANTTSTNIYINNNGFPISIKQINIDSGSMKVTILCDNTKSNYELEILNGQYPEEPATYGEFSQKYYDKFDLDNWEYIDPTE